MKQSAVGLLVGVALLSVPLRPADAEVFPGERAQDLGSFAVESVDSAANESRGPTVFMPSAANLVSSNKDLFPEPQGIDEGDILYNAYCQCFWDWCVENDWSVCVNPECYVIGC